MNLFGCFTNRRGRDKGNETGLKEEGVMEMSTTVLPFTITIFTIYYSDTIILSNKKMITIITTSI